MWLCMAWLRRGFGKGRWQWYGRFFPHIFCLLVDFLSVFQLFLYICLSFCFFCSSFIWDFFLVDFCEAIILAPFFCIVLLAAEASKRGQEKLKTEIQINVKKSEQHKNGFLLIEFLILNSTCSLRFNCYVHFTSRDLEQRGVNSYFKCCCI